MQKPSKASQGTSSVSLLGYCCSVIYTFTTSSWLVHQQLAWSATWLAENPLSSSITSNLWATDHQKFVQALGKHYSTIVRMLQIFVICS